MKMNLIDTASFSANLRSKAINRDSEKLLIARLKDSRQENDLSEPVNCGGVGRIRHFKRGTSHGWPSNPLPIDPAAKKLGLPRQEVVRAQVFQNAACNWRCWYCYVPFDLLKADEKRGIWLTSDEMLTLYTSEPSPPLIIDLSGGQPDLTPEWVPWMMKALDNRGLSGTTYLWSDDNLSTDYFWSKLTTPEIDRVLNYKNYGKVGCFKGFDASSFSFNTRAAPELFDNQFNLFERIIRTGLDIYGYATFTSNDEKNIDTKMHDFVDRLQSISRLLPLRLIPLQVSSFGAIVSEGRIGAEQLRSMAIQGEAIQRWNSELEKRFTIAERKLPIYEVAIR